MNGGASTRRLSELTQKITDGSHNPPKGIQDSKYLMLSSKNIFDDDINYSNPRFLSAEHFSQENKRTAIKPGDVLLTIVGTIGRCAIVPPEIPQFTLQRSVAVIRPDREVLLSRFLMYTFMWRNADLNEQARGVAQKGIYLEALRDLEIDTPPILEQQRLVDILDRAFEGIATAKAHAEKNLQNARALFTTGVHAAFSNHDGWEEKSLGDIAQVKGGKRVPKGYKLLSEATPFPYIRVTDFNDFGSIDLDDLRYVSAAVHKQIRNYVIYSSDMYLSIAGTIGKTGIIPKELDGAQLTENACRLVFKPGINNRFVYYFTTTQSFVEQAGFNTRTAAQPKLALSRLSTIRLGIPSFAVQESLVETFDNLREETRHLESLYQSKVKALDKLRKSLLHQAFTGQL